MPVQYVGNSITKAAEPDGSGGYRSAIEVTPEPTGDPVISSVADNGDGTLTITGSNFGSKAQAAPLAHDIGGNAWIDGVLNAWTSALADGHLPQDNPDNPDNPYLTFSADKKISHDGVFIDKSQATRTAGQDCNYLLKGGQARIGAIRNFVEGKTPPGYHQMYWAAWMAQKYHNGYWQTTGTVTGGPFVKDEPVEVVGEAMAGVYIDTEDADGGIHNFNFNTNSFSSSQFAGKTIRGLTSGAEVVFETVSKGSGSVGYVTPGTKYARVRDEGNNTFTNGSYEAIVGSVSDSDYYMNRASVNDTYYSGVSIEQAPAGEFVLHEIELDIDPETNIGRFVCYVGGEKRLDSSGEEYVVDLNERDLNHSPYVSIFGFDGRHVFQEARIAEIYTDNSVQRVLLGNAATWSEVTHYELQSADIWSNENIEVRKNLGELSGGWIYVVGPTRGINETGVAI